MSSIVMKKRMKKLSYYFWKFFLFFKKWSYIQGQIKNFRSHKFFTNFISRNGILEFLNICMLEIFIFRILEFWDFRNLEFLNFQILRIWNFINFGVGFWDFAVFRFWEFGVPGFLNFWILKFYLTIGDFKV